MANEVADSQKQTLASAMYRELRSEILTAAIAPEAKLNIRELCDRFCVGLSPMREALSRLSAEGLVQQVDNRGFAVMPVSVPELLDLTKARCWTNEIGLRQSILNGGEPWEENLVLSVHRLSRTPRYLNGDTLARNVAWEDAHRIFHRALIGGCGSHWLVETCERMFDASERYRHLARLAGMSRSKHEDEHKEIMQAAIEHRAEEAVQLLNQHFITTAQLVQAVVQVDLAKVAPRPRRQTIEAAVAASAARLSTIASK
jgi:GntR family transcriptional regulator, carbon starvation induced regulator